MFQSLKYKGLIIILFFSYFFYLSIIAEPRPYFLTTFTDVESDYYYNSKLVHHTGRPMNVVHPATPIFYLGGLIMALSGSAIEDTQSFFNLMYVCIFLFSIFSIWFFANLYFHKIPAAFFILTLTSILTWPPFIIYLDRFSTDSFALPLGIITYSIFWRSLKGFSIDKKILKILGFLIGLSIATKFTFIPFAIALIIASTIHTYLSQPNKYLNLFILPSWTIGSFSLFVLPNIFNISSLINKLIRHDAINDIISINIISKVSNFYALAKPFTIVTGITIIIYLIVYFNYLYKIIRNDYKKIYKQKFDHISGGISIFLMFLFLLLFISSLPESNLLYQLRNLSPLVLFVPIMILHLLQITEEETDLNRYKLLQLSTIILCVILLKSSITSVFNERSYHINESITSHNILREKLTKYQKPNKVIALWMEHGGGLQFGKESFHWWGSYKFSDEHFNEEVLNTFPNFVQFRVGHIVNELEKEQNINNKSLSSNLKSLLKKRFSWLKKKKFEKRGNIISGEHKNIELSAFIITNSTLKKLKMKKKRFYEVIKNRFGLKNIIYDGELIIITENFQK